MNFSNYNSLIPSNFNESINRDLVAENGKAYSHFFKRALIIMWSAVFIAAIFLFLYPFVPLFLYKDNSANFISKDSIENLNAYSELRQTNGLIPIDNSNTLIVPKIGVRIPVIEDSNPDRAWSKGAWRQGSTPDKGSNTVISAHRFKYKPPHERTFYLLDKLEAGDMFSLFWNNKEYVYRVTEKNVVSPMAVEVLDAREDSIVTLVTCHPLFSTSQRLVVVGELVGVN